MQFIILKTRALLFTVTFLIIAAGFLAPFSVEAQLNPSDAPAGLPQYSGVEQSIQDYLCTPQGQGTDLVDCVGRLYRFSLTAGGIALIFFIVLAGYLYITSGEAGKGKAKNILLSAVTGMGILLGSFVLLNFINPNLTQIRTIQPPIFSTANLPSCEAIGFSARCIISTGPSAGQVSSGNGTAYGGRGCTPITNNNSPASIDNLARTCWGRYGANVIRNASIVAANESGGRPIDVSVGSCGAGRRPARCTGGEVPVYGVFQINLAAHKVPDGNGNLLDCPSAFSRGSATFCSNGCTVTNRDLYNRCYQAIKNIQNEFAVACRIYDSNVARGRAPFHDWGNRANEHGSKCGF